MIRLAVGLMSGTSMDGIDAAILETDGRSVVRAIGSRTTLYGETLRQRLTRLVAAGHDDEAERRAVSGDVTDANAAAVEALLSANTLPLGRVDVIGFPGQTVLHRPEQGITRQVADGARLADRFGCAVVTDFRSADMAAGGQGAPFAPLFHAVLARQGVERPALPIGVLNIGGVANLTLIQGWEGDTPSLIAFDTGPGNALIDDWVAQHAGLSFDADGRLAASGRVDPGRVAALMAHPYFERPPPKSLDRQDFAAHASAVVDGLGAADGAATLAAFTVAAVARAAAHLPQSPLRWLVCGGGRRNGYLMAELGRALATPVEPVEAVGWDGDVLEAQAFAYLAVRSLDGLPLSLPGTTGVPRPMPGGVLHRPMSLSS